MITLFVILMLVVFGRILIWGIRAAWGLAKILLSVTLFPIILIIMAATGLLHVALVVLVVGGIAAFIAAAVS